MKLLVQTGKLRAQIIEDKLDDIDQQFDLLTEAIQSINSYPVGKILI